MASCIVAEPDPRRLRPFEIQLRIVFPRKADAAMQLDCLLRAKERGFVGSAFCTCNFQHQFLHSGGAIDTAVYTMLNLCNPGSAIHQRARRLQLDHHFGAAMLDRLKGCNDTAKLGPLTDIGKRQVQALLGAANLLRRQRQRRQRCRQLQAGLQLLRRVDTGLGIEPDVVQCQARDATCLVQRLQRFDTNATSRHVNCEQSKGIFGAIPTGRHQQQIGLLCTQHLRHAAMQYIGIALAPHHDLASLRIPAGGNRQRQRSAQLAAGQSRQVALLCRAMRCVLQGIGGQACTCQVRYRRQAAAQLLHQ